MKRRLQTLAILHPEERDRPMFVEMDTCRITGMRAISEMSDVVR